MNVFLPLFFAFIAAVGNAMFVYGQRRSGESTNGFAFLGISVLLAGVLSCITSPLLGAPEFMQIMRSSGRNLLWSGLGLFVTYIGFNLMYSRFGASPYVLYAVLSILTTTVFIGMIWLREPVNGYKIAAIVMATASVILYSIGQSRTS